MIQPRAKGNIRYKRLPDESAAKGDIELRRKSVIRGRVVDAGGKPIASAEVDVYVWAEGSGTMDGKLSTDEDGRYESAEAVPGIEYGTLAKGDGYGQDWSTHFTLEEGDAKEIEELTLQVAELQIEGLVVDADEQPLAGAHVSCHGRATGSRSTESDDNGRFVLENLVDEQVTIWAYYSGPDGQVQGQVRAMAGDTDVEVVMGEGQSGQSDEEREAQRLIGKQAEELDIATWVRGEAASLAALRGKVVVLAFWDSAHGSSAEVVALLNQLVEDNADDGIAVIAVHCARSNDSDVEPAVLRRWLADNGVKFRVALDKPASGKSRGETFKKYNVRKSPAVFLVDAEGKVQFQDITPSAVKQALATLMAGK